MAQNAGSSWGTKSKKWRPTCKNAKTIKKPGKNSGINPSLNSDASQVSLQAEQTQPLISYDHLTSLSNQDMDEDLLESGNEMERDDQEGDGSIGLPGLQYNYHQFGLPGMQHDYERFRWVTQTPPSLKQDYERVLQPPMHYGALAPSFEQDFEQVLQPPMQPALQHDYEQFRQVTQTPPGEFAPSFKQDYEQVLQPPMQPALQHNYEWFGRVTQTPPGELTPSFKQDYERVLQPPMQPALQHDYEWFRRVTQTPASLEQDHEWVPQPPMHYGGLVPSFEQDYEWVPV
ncbi:hypothetical protein EDB19DRAFT_1915426 [Suillus lakei]|nr:hypothetical protein EDB19DRAFT_1915426 [Suillus lakei]